jgi:hypothetical protein
VGAGPVIVIIVIEFVRLTGVVELFIVEVVEVVTLAVASPLVVLFWHECLTSARQAFRRLGCAPVTRSVTAAQPDAP